MRAPLVPVTIALLVGILCGASGFGPWPGLAVGILGAGLVVRWAKAPRIAVIGVLLLWGSVGWLRLSLWRAHPSAFLEQQLPEEPQPVRLHGVIRDDPVELFEPNEPQVRQTCVIELRHVLRAGAWEPISGRLRAVLQSPRTRVSYGDELLVEGVWHRVPAPGNPGQYDWRASLARSHIHGLFRGRPADGIVVVQSHRGHPLLEAVFHLRARWEALIRQTFNERDAGLLVSLLLGQRVALDEELKDAFVETGTIHVLAWQCTKLNRDSLAGYITL